MTRSARTEAVFGIRTTLHLPSPRLARPPALSDRVPRLGSPPGEARRDPAGDPASLPEPTRAREVSRFARQEQLVSEAQERLLRMRQELSIRVGQNQALQELRRNTVEDRRERWYGRGRP